MKHPNTITCYKRILNTVQLALTTNFALPLAGCTAPLASNNTRTPRCPGIATDFPGPSLGMTRTPNARYAVVEELIGFYSKMQGVQILCKIDS